MTIRRQKDFAAGLMFIALGLAFAFLARGYRMGVASSMGPGYFPFWLGVILAILGLFVFISSLAGREEDKIGRLDVWRFAIVGISVLLFGVLLHPLGLMVAVAVLAFVSSLAGREFTWLGATMTTLALVAISVAIFVYGLSLPMPLLPAFLSG